MTPGVSSRTVASMGTLVTIQAVGGDGGAARRDEAISRALGWFDRVEACCTRFDAASEVMQLVSRIGEAVPASALLFDVVAFALEVAEESGGAFDLTVGHRMERLGFNREHRTRALISTAIEPGAPVSYRDVVLDPDRRTITLGRPLVLDLGAVAKGLAVDLAARELAEFAGFAIDGGGDLYLGGRNAEGEPWSVGIRHPRNHETLIDRIRVSDAAVCTSGDYERPAPNGGGHHIIDPRGGASPRGAASVTVIAPTAMLADALATAAFVMGPADGIDWLERHHVRGLIVTPSLERFETRGMAA